MTACPVDEKGCCDGGYAHEVTSRLERRRMCQDVFHQSKDAPSRDPNLSFHTRSLENSHLTAFELVTILEEYKDVLNMAQ